MGTLYQRYAACTASTPLATEGSDSRFGFFTVPSFDAWAGLIRPLVARTAVVAGEVTIGSNSRVLHGAVLNGPHR